MLDSIRQGRSRFPELFPGQMARDWIVMNRIGAGGMGTVYLVQKSGSTEECALKVTDQYPELPGGHEASMMQAACPMNHSPRVYESWEEKGRAFIVMEFIRGRPLNELFRSWAGRLSASQIRWALLGMLGELQRLHTLPRPIVYGDPKPGNYIVDPNGNFVLVDYANARYVGDTFRLLQGEGEFFIRGTPSYIPSEHLDTTGRGVVIDPKSDLYSVGVVGWELLVGEKAPKFGPVPPLDLRNLPRDMRAIANTVNLATRMDRTKRPGSAGVFMEALHD